MVWSRDTEFVLVTRTVGMFGDKRGLYKEWVCFVADGSDVLAEFDSIVNSKPQDISAQILAVPARRFRFGRRLST